MAVPKRKVSKSKSRQRKKANDLKKSQTPVQKCAQCGAASQPHRVCAACGYYKGRQVLTVDAD
jgi:large subunit ribosomal protein L32